MKRPWQPNKRKRQKTHGFLVRMARKGGGRISRLIRNRRKKGRSSLAPQAYSK